MTAATAASVPPPALTASIAAIASSSDAKNVPRRLSFVGFSLVTLVLAIQALSIRLVYNLATKKERAKS